jgi:bifunctional non-homologous end joining protein LigD
MSLEDYRRKRQFAQTPEPARNGPRAKKPIFVVQLHHASHRHYDFRLEVNGTLKSWAIPKGPSLDPSVKRLAVQVEDHPLSYAAFAGDIPQGNYGAGHVDIFDKGTWLPEASARAALAKGELKFELFGKILRGSWVLVRTKREAAKPQWLLIKHRDEFANGKEADDYVPDESTSAKVAKSKIAANHASRQSAVAKNVEPARPTSLKLRAPKISSVRLPELSADGGAFAPELCRSADKPPAGNDWLHEIKWDGYRLLTTIVKGRVRVWSRNAIEWTQRIPDIVTALQRLKLDSAQLDGELLVLKDGRADFSALQARLSGESDARLVYMLFDMPGLDGLSLHDMPLRERKDRLAKLLRKTRLAALRFSEHHVGAGEIALQQATAAGLEGIVSKRVNSPYRGERSGDWLKIKSRHSDEFAIIGYTEPRGTRSGIGALLLGKPIPKGYRYLGRVGTGLSNRQLTSLREQLQTTISNSEPSDTTLLDKKDRRSAIWVNPSLVVEVYFQGIGGHGLLRQPALKALREDKTLDDLQPADVQKKRTDGRGKSPAKRPAKSTHRKSAVLTRTVQKTQATLNAKSAAKPVSDGDVVITHPERIVYAELGLTKQDVANYYRQVAPQLLPHVANRPLSILRCPNGIGTACFFQKHAGKGWGKHIEPVDIKETIGKAQYMSIDDARGLLELVQMNVLELHPWNATNADPEHADRLVFDLDPHAKVAWPRVIAAARKLRKNLQSAGLQSFLRTSGGKGFHVVVPLKPTVPWVRAKVFAQAVALAMSELEPKEFVAVAGEKNRVGKIFIDWLRNSMGATSVAAYSLRARAEAGVAMPIDWNDIGKIKCGYAFTIANVPKFLKRRKRDPWHGIDEVEQTLDSSIGTRD